jgi:hypothetical protein
MYMNPVLQGHRNIKPVSNFSQIYILCRRGTILVVPIGKQCKFVGGSEICLSVLEINKPRYIHRCGYVTDERLEGSGLGRCALSRE